MSTAMDVLNRRLYSFLPEVKAKPLEVRERIRIIRVNGHPLRALGCRVNGVKADGDFAFEVATDCVQCQAEPLTGFPVLIDLCINNATI
jgi:hypothetical protein